MGAPCGRGGGAQTPLSFAFLTFSPPPLCGAQVVFPQNQQINKYDYDETGPSIVHRKCC